MRSCDTRTPGAMICWIVGTLLIVSFAGCGTENDDDDSSGTTPTPEGGDDDSSLPEPTPTPVADLDGDGILNGDDNCVDTANPDQEDTDEDGLGDACSSEACDGLDNDGDGGVDEDFPDGDGDGLADCVDDCGADPDNDVDKDGICGDVDNCPLSENISQDDSDADGLGDACDVCELDPDNDSDGDRACADADNCPDVANEDQADADGDGAGDACDACPNDADDDADGDGICGDVDNCPAEANANQMDRDQDGVGDACDPCPDDNPDDDEDGACGPEEMTPAPDASLYILATNPAEGYKGVLLNPNGFIRFNEDYAGDPGKISVKIVSQGGEITEVSLIDNASYIFFYPILEADTDYCMLIKVEFQEDVNAIWPLDRSACFTTRVPCGVPIDVGYNTQIDTLGGSVAAKNALNSAIQETGNDYPVVLLLENLKSTQRFPISDFTAVLGAYNTLEDGNNVVGSEGYTSSFEGCTVASNGNLQCSGDVATFPVYNDTFSINLYVTDPQIDGDLVSDGNVRLLNDFRLRGVVTEADILRMEAEAGQPIISEVVQLNVDLNDDGVPDAATFQLSTSPVELALEGASCE